MSERYTHLYFLPNNLYSTGAPVIISAGTLLKDIQTNQILVQLKMQNISEKTIIAVKVKIYPFNVAKESLGQELESDYLDLNISRDEFFGQNTAIPLEDLTTRSFSISIVQVIFQDGSIWNSTNTQWEPLFTPTPLIDLLKNDALVEQFQLEYGNDSKYCFKESSELWFCPCGTWNKKEEVHCHKCNKKIDVLRTINYDLLKKKCDIRIADEKKKIQTNKKKIISISIAIFIVLIVSLCYFLLKPNSVHYANKENNNNTVTEMTSGDIKDTVKSIAYSIDSLNNSELHSLFDSIETSIESADNIDYAIAYKHPSKPQINIDIYIDFIPTEVYSSIQNDVEKIASNINKITNKSQEYNTVKISIFDNNHALVVSGNSTT